MSPPFQRIAGFLGCSGGSISLDHYSWHRTPWASAAIPAVVRERVARWSTFDGPSCSNYLVSGRPEPECRGPRGRLPVLAFGNCARRWPCCYWAFAPVASRKAPTSLGLSPSCYLIALAQCSLWCSRLCPSGQVSLSGRGCCSSNSSCRHWTWRGWYQPTVGYT